MGILTTLLFTLPPLLAIRKVRPALILRRDMPEAKLTWRRRLADARLSVAAGGVILLGIGGIAAWLAESPRVGGYFAGGLTVALILLALVASGFLRLIRTVVRRSPWRIPTLARQGFANLYRQGNQAQAILVALGLGVMFTLTVYLVQHSLVGEIIQSAPPDAPNVFLIGITPEQVGPLKALIAKQKGVVAPPEFAPSVAVRIESLNGVPLEELRVTGMSRRFRGSRSVMWAEEKPSSLTVVQGKWWTPGRNAAGGFRGSRGRADAGGEAGRHHRAFRSRTNLHRAHRGAAPRGADARGRGQRVRIQSAGAARGCRRRSMAACACSRPTSGRSSARLTRPSRP